MTVQEVMVMAAAVRVVRAYANSCRPIGVELCNALEALGDEVRAWEDAQAGYEYKSMTADYEIKSDDWRR